MLFPDSTRPQNSANPCGTKTSLPTEWFATGKKGTFYFLCGTGFTGACCQIPPSHHSEKQSVAADLLLLDTGKSIDHFENTLGQG